MISGKKKTQTQPAAFSDIAGYPATKSLNTNV